MDEATRDLVRAWLTKAEHDLAAARKLASGFDPYLDTAIYHCQQAAEKALKGFLVFHAQRFEKVHNLPLLISQAVPFAAGFSEVLDAAEQLTPYATAFRYPGEFLDPDPEEFDGALAAAAHILEAVLTVLPAEVHP